MSEVLEQKKVQKGLTEFEEKNGFSVVTEMKFIRTWKNSRYGHHEVDPEKTIRVVDKQGLIDSIPKIINIQTKIPENSNVYFSKSVTYPRSKFKEIFPTCKIVRDINKADVIIYDFSGYSSSLQNLDLRECKLLSNGMYLSSSKCLAGDKDNKDILDYLKNKGITINHRQVIKVIDEPYWRTTNISKLAEILDFKSLNNDNLIYIDVNNINNDNGAMMDDKAYEKIESMFNSTDNNLYNLGIRMLTSYNYEENRFKIAKLLFYHWNTLSRYIRKNVDIKTLINKYMRDYGKFNTRRSYYHNHGLNASTFWVAQLSYYETEEQLNEITQQIKDLLYINEEDNIEITVKRKYETSSKSTKISDVLNITFRNDDEDEDDDDEDDYSDNRINTIIDNE